MTTDESEDESKLNAAQAEARNARVVAFTKDQPAPSSALTSVVSSADPLEQVQAARDEVKSTETATTDQRVADGLSEILSADPHSGNQDERRGLGMLLTAGKRNQVAAKDQALERKTQTGMSESQGMPIDPDNQTPTEQHATKVTQMPSAKRVKRFKPPAPDDIMMRDVARQPRLLDDPMQESDITRVQDVARTQRPLSEAPRGGENPANASEQAANTRVAETDLEELATRRRLAQNAAQGIHFVQPSEEMMRRDFDGVHREAIMEPLGLQEARRSLDVREAMATPPTESLRRGQTITLGHNRRNERFDAAFNSRAMDQLTNPNDPISLSLAHQQRQAAQSGTVAVSEQSPFARNLSFF